MDGAGDLKRETNPDTLRDGNQKLRLFVCGLCNCSYDQFVSFYKHFKNHIKEVGQDCFHICEDLSSSERDICEDQSESPEMPTFNCGICPTSFITVCMLHEHMEKHESKGSYTLDMQSKTGYPSPQQYPCVKLGKVNHSSFSIHVPEGISSDSQVKSKRRRPSKHGPQGAIGNRIDRASKNLPSQDTDRLCEASKEQKNRRGKPPKHKPLNEMKTQEKEVDSRKGKSLLHRNVSEDFSMLDAQIKPRSGRSRKVLPSKDVASVPDATLKCRQGRTSRNKHMAIKHEEMDTIKPEPAVNMNESSGRTFLVERQEDVKVFVESAILEDNDKNQKNMETEEDCRVDDLEDGGNAFKDDRYSDTDNNCEHEDEEDDNSVYVEEVKLPPMETENKVKENTDTECVDREMEENLHGDIEETDKITTRGKQTSSSQVKSSARKSDKGKKFFFGEVCGMKRVKHLLVKHVEQTHGGVELSQEFKQTLGELKCAEQNREKRKYVKMVKDPDYVPEESPPPCRKKRKHVNKMKGEQLKDPDFIPEDESESSQSLEPGIVKRVLIKVFHSGATPRYYVECNYCGLALSSEHIKKHERYHNTPAGRKKFSPENLTDCEKCGRVLQKSQMSQHKCWLNIMRQEKEIETSKLDKKEKVRRKSHQLTPCHMCGNLVKRYLLRSHLLSHSDARPFPCQKCPKAFKTLTCLKSHELCAHGERSYQCDQCPWAFTNKASLKNHYLQHTGERRFSCTMCGKQFQRSTQLKRHMHIHDEVASNACKECPKTFKTRASLLRHVSIMHKKERFWICSWEGCLKTFTGSFKLRRHMIVHTGEKPEKCNLCDAGFAQREGLKVHMRQKHNTNEVPPANPVVPYSDVVPQFIEVPGSGKDKDKPITYKTIMFTKSTMSKTDKEKLKYHFTVQFKSMKRDQKAASTVQRNLDVKAQPESSVSDAKPVLEKIDRTIADKQDCLEVEATQKIEEEEEGEEEYDIDTVPEPLLTDDGDSDWNNVSLRTKVCVTDSRIKLETSDLSSYRNTTAEPGTSNINTGNMQGASHLTKYSNTFLDMKTSSTSCRQQEKNTPIVTGRGSITSGCDTSSTSHNGGIHPLYSNTVQEPGTCREGPGLMQESSNLSMPFVYDGHKVEMDRSTMGVHLMETVSVSVPSSMATGIPYPAADYSYKTF